MKTSCLRRFVIRLKNIAPGTCEAMRIKYIQNYRTKIELKNIMNINCSCDLYCVAIISLVFGIVAAICFII